MSLFPVSQDVFSAAHHNAGAQVETFGSVLHPTNHSVGETQSIEHMGNCTARAPPS